MTTPNINQFAVTPVQGMTDLMWGGEGVITAQVKSDEAVALVAGQAVKLADVAGGPPVITALAANTDAPFGFVAYNLKDRTYPASSKVELALGGSVIYMTAGAAIARGAKVEVVNATFKVITNAGVNPVSGFALDKASADGDLIRVMIITPYSSAQVIADIAGLQTALDAKPNTIQISATLAEINAGKVLIAGSGTKKITVTNYIARVTGNFAAGTSVELESTAGSPVAVTTIAEAGLTDAAILMPGSANTTLGVGFGAQLGAGDGLKVVNNGSAQTTATKIDFTITFLQA